jgi:hypothetical protein
MAGPAAQARQGKPRLPRLGLQGGAEFSFPLGKGKASPFRRATARPAHSSAPAIHTRTRRFFLTIAIPQMSAQRERERGIRRLALGYSGNPARDAPRRIRLFPSAAPASDPTGHAGRSARCTGFSAYDPRPAPSRRLAMAPLVEPRCSHRDMARNGGDYFLADGWRTNTLLLRPQQAGLALRS